MKKLPIGQSDFKNIITENAYYIDKSLLIKEVIDDDALVMLLPRPRRFGKTVNLSMLRYFFEKTEHEIVEVPYDHHGEGGHRFIIENFVNAILSGEPLIAPAKEGINSVMLGNAIILSSFQKKAVEIPIDEDAYEQQLQALIQQSTFQKVERL